MCAVVQSETALAPRDTGGNGIVPRPRLLQLLREQGRVALLSAAAGSGKTVLLRSWIGEIPPGEGIAWVSVDREERDAQRFWLSVIQALRNTCAASTLVRALSAAPGLDGQSIVEQLLEDLESLDGQLWLVIDDLHELHSAEALCQLELLLRNAPPELRFVLSTRQNPSLGLHRLRLEGGLTEIGARSLRFTPEEARALFDAADVEVSDTGLSALLECTEGWAAGLRLAALSLAGHPDPERLAREFSGSERTVSEYLLAEVLDRQPEEVRRLLLCTSVLERVSGPLADALTGGSGGQGILNELEQANAFVVSVDGERCWFRYHKLFADLLALELRRAQPTAIPPLHSAAAEWHAHHGSPVEAIRHAQAAGDWGFAGRLLCDHWSGLRLDGQSTTLHELLAVFPASVVQADPELLSLLAADHLHQGTLEDAERCLDLAEMGLMSVPAERRERFQLRLATRRLRIARQRGNLPAVVEEAQQLLAPAGASDRVRVGLDPELRAMALIELGVAELWSTRLQYVDQHFEQGIALARRTRRPYLEVDGMAHWAMVGVSSSYSLAVERSMEAIRLADRHGWSDEPTVAVAYLTLGIVRVWQGRLEEAEPWLERTEVALRAEVESAARMVLYRTRALVELARGRDNEALEAFEAAERHANLLVKPHPIATRMQAHRLGALVRMGRLEQVERALAEMDEPELATGEMRTVVAALRLAQGDPAAASLAVQPVLDGSADVVSRQIWLVQAHLLEAIARDELGDAEAVGCSLERALDLAEPDGVLLPFLLHPASGLLERHTRHNTAHASLVSEVRGLLTGRKANPAAMPLLDPLSESETRVLRYLPTNLSLREIGNELYVTVHTVKTHIKHIYGKLGVHSRGEAVEQARNLGLLAPSPRRR